MKFPARNFFFDSSTWSESVFKVVSLRLAFSEKKNLSLYRSERARAQRSVDMTFFPIANNATIFYIELFFLLFHPLTSRCSLLTELSALSLCKPSPTSLATMTHDGISRSLLAMLSRKIFLHDSKSEL